MVKLVAKIAWQAIKKLFFNHIFQHSYAFMFILKKQKHMSTKSCTQIFTVFMCNSLVVTDSKVAPTVTVF